MSTAITTASEFAKISTAKSCDNKRKALQLTGDVMRISRSLFPLKTSQYLADLTGYSERSCQYWLSGAVVIPSDALASLMRSDNGREFLVAVMADNTPRWWLRLKAWLSAIDLAAEQAKHRRKLRELLDDAAPHSAFVSDPEFFEGLPNPHRAMVQKRKGK